MRILDGYIGKAVIGGVLLVMCVLLALFVFIEFISEMDKIGQGHYTAWEALKYVLFSVPRLAYELMPLGALLGSLIGLGLLASHNEIIIMRTCGVSRARISWSAVKAGLLLIVFSAWLGEWVIADAEDYAANVRSSALTGTSSLQTRGGFWTRDGANFINVRAVAEGGELAGILIYEFGEQSELRRISSARSAEYRDGQWLLKDVERSEIRAHEVVTQHVPDAPWQSRLNPALLEIIAVKPASLSISGLYHYIAYLRDNDLSTARYEIEFWTKLMLPLSTCVMVFAALPFVFGPLRSVGVGQRILVGVVVGMGFYLLNQAVSYLGLIYGFNAVFCGVFPTVFFLALSVLMMRRAS